MIEPCGRDCWLLPVGLEATGAKSPLFGVFVSTMIAYRIASSNFCIIRSEGMSILAHKHGGTWVFYVIAPVILCGVVACLWWMVKGAIGVFSRKPRG